jgi:hypothetical protein
MKKDEHEHQVEHNIKLNTTSSHLQVKVSMKKDEHEHQVNIILLKKTFINKKK